MFKHLVFRNVNPIFKRLYRVNESIAHFLKNGKVGQDITVKGWIKSLRKQKELIFIDLNDGSTPQRLQILLPSKMSPQKLTVGSSIEATGTITLSPKGNLEVSADNVHLYCDCDVNAGYPFAPRKHYSPEYVREYLHLRPRTRTFMSVLRVRDRAVIEINNYLNNQGYINIHTPILTSNDCEGAGETFNVVPERIDLVKSMAKENVSHDEIYFDNKVYLSVSGQLHLEVAAHALSKVFTLGPTFRAENSKSRFHLSEFYMLEAEIAFLTKLEDLMGIIEDLIKSVTQILIDKCAGDIEMCRGDKRDFTWLNKNFEVVTYKEAMNIFKNKMHKEMPISGKIPKEYELELVEYFDNIPVFIIDWPKQMKPFYMKECEDGENVAALDLLAPGVGEVVGGSLREDSYEKLYSRISQDENNLKWYLDLRKFGGVATAGFGLGFDRYIQSILGISSIKDVIPFPRWPHNCQL
ncbi:probable asparagine--tRNA ligase, mitochondrial [Cylas formicarius]|uniref:probable asparagine--tRNA ligase, mitochondrial n=1 Tax=Cylas formicarius TaxID=197179 RepID=UPI002958567D|nr:probable asparagine--tRNA ligase, mitochondrial [Cylas formicarius]